MSVQHQDLCHATEILRSRTMRPMTLGTTIMDPITFGDPVDLHRQPGRYVGCFSLRKNGDIFFFLGTRVNYENHLIYTYIFYLNEDYSSIQPSEIQLMKPYLADIEQKSRIGYIGVVNIRCLLHPSLHLSMFLEAIDSLLDLDLSRDFIPLRFVDTEALDLSVGPVRNCQLGHCKGYPEVELIGLFADYAIELGLSFSYCPEGCITKKTDTILLRTDGHMVGIIINKYANYVNHILLHRNQYNSGQHYAKIVGHINEVYRNKSFSHFCTRVCPTTFVTCYGKEVQMAWKLCLALSPNVLTVIREEELDYSFGSDKMFSMRIRNHQIGIVLRPYNMPSQPRPRDSSQVNIILKNTGAIVRTDKQSQSQTDSQSTQIMDHKTWRTNLSTWNDIVRENRRIKDSLIPPIHVMEPVNDLSQKYLKDFPSFEAALELMRTIWDRFAPTVLFCFPLSDSDTRSRVRRGARFTIYAVENDYTNEVAIIVADQVNKHWIVFSASNTEYKNKDYFEMILNRMRCFSALNGFTNEAIAITSHFHPEYPKLHLIMSLYVISRLFEYCVSLPKRIVYGERELRIYGNNICTALQVVNNNYNDENDLIDEDGRLRSGAKRSLLSPIRYVNSSVVPKDLCMFCKKRGFTNLGRHYAAKHGQQGKLANRIQNEQRRTV